MGNRGRDRRLLQGRAPRSVKGGHCTCPTSTLPRDPQEEGSQDPLHVTPRGRDPSHVIGGGSPEASSRDWGEGGAGACGLARPRPQFPGPLHSRLRSTSLSRFMGPRLPQ